MTLHFRSRSAEWPDPLPEEEQDDDTQSTVSDDPLTRPSIPPGYAPDAFQTEQWVDDALKA